MRGQIINNWNLFDPSKKDHQKSLLTNLQFFVSIPDLFVPDRYGGADDLSKEFRKQHQAYKKVQMANIQAFTIPGDMPTSVLPIVDTFTAIPYYDNGYESIFQVMNMTGSKRGGFRMIDIQSGLAFRRIDIGETLDVFAMSGTDVTVNFDKYGGALGWEKTLFDDEEYVTLEDLAVQFRNVAFNQRASVFYALIEAVSAEKGCCSWITPHVAGTDPVYYALGDALTLNYMAENILTRVQNKGYGITPNNASFVILTPIGLVYRMRQALGQVLQAVAGSGRTINYSFTIISSLLLTSATRVFVILPKIKLKAGYRMDLTMFQDFDLLSYTEVQAGWMRYAGIVGDTDQIECVDLDPISGSCPPTIESD